MIDIIYMGATILFFIACISLVEALSRLMGG